MRRRDLAKAREGGDAPLLARRRLPPFGPAAQRPALPLPAQLFVHVAHVVPVVEGHRSLVLPARNTSVDR